MTAQDTVARDSLGRLDALDTVRGLALVGMFVFHIAWDLGFFGFISPDFPYSPGFMAFGHVVAATFLAVAGASLALASWNGLNWRSWGLRLAMIVAAAALITTVTWFAFPESFIFFGILHCIAAASVAALPFLRVRPWVTFAFALAIVFAPFLVAVSAFDAPAFWWVGLGLSEPRSNDLRTFFPWAGFLLAGLAAMRFGLARGLPRSFAGWKAESPVARLLTLGGRHSLLIYLVHQPVFIALVYLASLAMPTREEANYLRACEQQCVTSGGAPAVCSNACGCFAQGLKAERLWYKALRNSLDAAETLRFNAIAQQCSRDAKP